MDVPRWIVAVPVRLRSILRRARIERELDDELAFHVAMDARVARDAGLSETDAVRRATLDLGGLSQAKERCRDMWPLRWAEDLLRDVRYGLRGLRRTPAFTATAVTILALGIGATSAIATLIDQVMLRPLPVVRPGELWRIGDHVGCCYSTGYAQNHWSFFSWDAYKLFRANTPAFEELAAFQVGNTELNVRRYGSPAALVTANGEFVSGNFFETFGIAAWRGHVFTDADDQAAASPVAVMSFRTWQGKYGGDPSVIGAMLQINGLPFTIVGVTPASFFGAKVADSAMPDFWLPLATEPRVRGDTSRLANPRLAWLDVIGRVRPATNIQSLETQLQAELHQWLESHAADMTSQERTPFENQTVRLVPGGAGVSLMRANYTQQLQLMLAAAVAVLLVACANIANLLLSRGLRHRHQTALRGALGASQTRLVRQALTESLILAVLGAVAGIVVAYGGTALLLRLAFGRGDTWVPLSAIPPPTVLLFALALSVVTGIAFGIAPSAMTARADPIEALRESTRSGRSTRHWAQPMLIIAQVVASLVLLSAAAMLGQSLRHLQQQDFGFEPRDRYMVTISTMLSGYRPQQLVSALQAIKDRVRTVPGVRMASAALYAPMSGLHWSHEVRIIGKPEPRPTDDTSSDWSRVTSGFFETLGARIVMGRPFTDEDTHDSRPVAVINQAFARQFFVNGNPLGQHFGPASRGKGGVYEIVGVVSDIRYFPDLGTPVRPMYFVPQAQTAHFDDASLQGREVWSHYPYNIVIWAPGRPDIEAEVRRALAPFDVPIYDVRAYSDVIRSSFARQNAIATLTWLFALLALVLAAVGIYGVTMYDVEQRTHEIGVRMALGATPRSVVIMVLRGTWWQLAVGLALGIPAAVGAGNLIASQLFDVRPSDPQILAAVFVILTLAASLAACIPARRAAGVQPMRALSEE